MSLRLITPLLALMITSQLSAAEQKDGDRPPGPPPGAMFERFDQDGDKLLSRAEFVRGMIAQHRHRPDGGDQDRPRHPDGAGEGEGRPHPPGAGEGRPRPEGNGEGRPTRPPGEGKGHHHPPGDGEGRPRPEGNGEGKGHHHPPGDGEGRPRPPGDGPLEKAFEKGDADKSGTLTREEFRAALQNLPRPPAHRPPGQGDGDRPRPAQEK